MAVSILDMQQRAFQMQDVKALRMKRYDARISPIIEELITYGLGLNAIARALNERGVPSPNGGKNTGQSVRRTIERLGLEH